MKLKIFDKKNTPVSSQRSGKPAIHINRSGMFTINKFAITLLDLSDIANIKFAQDEEESIWLWI